MALGTIIPEFPVMCILMAGSALVHSYTNAILEHTQRITGLLVAGEAIRGLVLAVQFEIRRVVIESVLAREDVEAYFGMALCAGVIEVRRMRIVVACLAIRMRNIRESLELLSLTRGRFVALLAIHVHVLAS